MTAAAMQWRQTDNTIGDVRAPEHLPDYPTILSLMLVVHQWLSCPSVQQLLYREFKTVPRQGLVQDVQSSRDLMRGTHLRGVSGTPVQLLPVGHTPPQRDQSLALIRLHLLMFSWLSNPMSSLWSP